MNRPTTVKEYHENSLGKGTGAVVKGMVLGEHARLCRMWLFGIHGYMDSSLS
jgi:hypothetical protein